MISVMPILLFIFLRLSILYFYLSLISNLSYTFSKICMHIYFAFQQILLPFHLFLNLLVLWKHFVYKSLEILWRTICLDSSPFAFIHSVSIYWAPAMCQEGSKYLGTRELKTSAPVKLLSKRWWHTMNNLL